MNDHDVDRMWTCIINSLMVIAVCALIVVLAIVIEKAQAEQEERWVCNAIKGVSVFQDVQEMPYIGGEEGYSGLPYGLETVPFLLPITEDRASNYYLAFSQKLQTLYIWTLPDSETDSEGNVHTACELLIAVHFDGIQ